MILSRVLLLVVACLLVAAPVRAELVLRNGMVYDSLQDLTFLQDVRLARTLGQNDDGLFNWHDADEWVTNLTFAGHDDWRLPELFRGCGPLSTNCTSEISRMLVHLGWTNRSDSWGDYYPGTVSPFLNLSNQSYDQAWLDSGYVWSITWQYDIPDRGFDALRTAWAVRDGAPVGVPEPSTLLLLAIGGLFASLKRR